MPAPPVNYVFACSGPVLLARAQDNVTSVPVMNGSTVVTPSAGTYQLRDMAGQTVAAPVVSIGVDGIAYVTILAADLPATRTLGEGYAEYWTLTVDSVVRPFRRDAVLSLFELHPPMPETDIVEGEYPSLLTDVSGYSDSLQPYMDGAWKELVRTLVKRGDFPDIIVEPSDVYDWFRQMTLERIFRMLYRAQESERYKQLWEFHRQKAEEEKAGCRFKTDRARSGIPDSLAREPAARSIHMNLPPKRRTYSNEW